MKAVEPRVRVREIVGTSAQIAAVVGGLRGQGYVVRVANRRQVGNRVTAHLHVTPTTARTRAQPAPVRRPLWRRRWPYVAVFLSFTAAGLAAVTVWLVQLVIAHLALFVGALLLTVALIASLGRAGVCVGVHCPGCRHGR